MCNVVPIRLQDRDNSWSIIIISNSNGNLKRTLCTPIGATPLHVQVRRQRPSHRWPQTPVGAPRGRRSARRVQRRGAGRSSPQSDLHGRQAQRLQRSRPSRAPRPPPSTLRTSRRGMIVVDGLIILILII